MYVQAVRGSTVQGGSTYRQYRRCVGDIMRIYHICLVPPVAQWFEEVQ